MLTNISSAVQTGISATDIGARLSANGRYVAFSSNQQLLPADTTALDGDIYIRDLQTNGLTLVSSGAGGATLDSTKTGATLSSDGRTIAFQSTTGAGASLHASILVKNLDADVLFSVSTNSAGAEANGSSYNAAISADGRYIAFVSKGSNLVASDTNGTDDVFVKDRITGAVINASTTAAGVQANVSSADTAISGDGRTVAFTTYASNLWADPGSYANIYAKQLDTGALVRVSENAHGIGANGNSDNAVLSANGRYAVFSSTATNLVDWDSNAHRDVFRKDLVDGSIVRVSTNADGLQGMGDSGNASVSADGRYIMFESTSDLTAGDGDGRTDLFIKDIVSGALTRLSATGDANHYNYASNGALAGDGLSAVYASYQFVAGPASDTREITRVALGAGFGDTAAQTLTGGAGVDVILGNQGRDLISGLAGSDVIDGGGGVDTAVYAGARANFTVTIAASGATLADTTGAEGSDKLANVERIHFADADLALDISGNAGQAYRLYQAAFDRAPDLAGLGFWINARDNNVTMASIAHDFLISPEGQTLYGSAPANADALTRFYSNVLHRAPDAAGYAFWLTALDNGQETQANVLAQFSESPENQAQVIGAIQSGITYTPFG